MKNKVSNEEVSGNVNNYMIFSDSIIFLDPLFIFIYNKKKDGFDLNQILSLPFTAFPNNRKPDKTIIQHYLLKCDFFNHYYQKKSLGGEKFKILKVEDIESKLANLNQITFEVTDSCNLKCKYCGYGDFYNDYDERKDKELNIDSAKIILDYLITIWNSNLNLSHNWNVYISFYGGEPLLNMKFIKGIVNYINSRPLIHNHITFSMTTNGLLLRKNINYLVKNNFKLLISLDGDINHNSYRVFQNGSESFSTVYKNIKYVKERFPEYFNKMISFNSVLHNRNSVSGIYNFIKKEFKKLPNISELNNSGIKPEKRGEFFKTYQNENESLMQAEDYTYIKKDMLFKVGEAFGVGLFLHQYSGNIFQDYNDFFINKDTIKRIPTGTCIPFSKKMYITVNGKILACEKIGHQFALGRVTPKNVEIDFGEIVSKYNSYYSKIIDQCKHCFNIERCMQCIFNLDNITEKPVCKGFTNSQEFGRQINLEMFLLEDDPTLYHKIMTDLVIEM